MKGESQEEQFTRLKKVRSNIRKAESKTESPHSDNFALQEKTTAQCLKSDQGKTPSQDEAVFQRSAIERKQLTEPTDFSWIHEADLFWVNESSQVLRREAEMELRKKKNRNISDPKSKPSENLL